MINFKNFSIKRKLIAMQLLTTSIVLFFCFLFFMIYDVKVGADMLIRHLTSTAHTISANSVSALTFLDNGAAEEVLSSLDAEVDITNAWIYDKDGNLFAKYSKKDFQNFSFPKLDTNCCKKVAGCYLTRTGGIRRHGFLTVSKIITIGDETMGTVSMRLNEKRFHHLLVQGMVVTIIVLFVGMGVAFLLAILTQKSISRPILKLAGAGQNVIDTGDYSIRVEKEGQDEIGGLYDDFNRLMDQVHVREQERDKAYTSLRESEQKYRMLFDNMNDGFAYHKCLVDKDNKPVNYLFLEVNAAFEQYTGLKGPDIIGKKVTDVLPGIERADPNLIEVYGKVALAGENTNFELFFKPFGKWYSISAYSPEKGYFCTMFKDITVRKKSEALAKQHQEKLIHTDKMTTLGILVSGVAHEINNPNNFMLLNSNNLSDIWSDLKPHMDKYKEIKGDFQIAGLPYSEVREDVDMLLSGIIEGTERIRKIVESLKDFAKKDPGSMDQRVPVNTIIESSLIILSNLVKKRTDNLKVEYGKDVPPVKGNIQQIEQVIINLISNACQALENKGKSVTISTVHEEASNQVVVTIRDEGRGISSENMKHIMDPFFTTKRDSGGTGLGLSISYTIIKDHGGELKIESEEGKGTSATINLPAG